MDTRHLQYCYQILLLLPRLVELYHLPPFHFLHPLPAITLDWSIVSPKVYLSCWTTKEETRLKMEWVHQHDFWFYNRISIIRSSKKLDHLILSFILSTLTKALQEHLVSQLQTGKGWKMFSSSQRIFNSVK